MIKTYIIKIQSRNLIHDMRNELCSDSVHALLA